MLSKQDVIILLYNIIVVVSLAEIIQVDAG